jgi:hypothetical protein
MKGNEMTEKTPFEGNLSKAHKLSKKAQDVNEKGWPEQGAVFAAIGFLHVFIELTAQIRDHVKNQSK